MGTGSRYAAAPFLLAPALLLSWVSSPAPLLANGPVLDARLGRIPLAFHGAPLVEALRALGMNTRKGYVTFGVELYWTGPEPAVNLNLQPGTTVEEALRQIFDQAPEYSFGVWSS